MADDFVFGETSFSDHVVKRRQAELRGLWHAHRIAPRDPLPGRPVELTVDVGTDYRADAVYAYWTTADEQPWGRAGVAAVGQVVSLERVGVRWDDLIWNYVEVWRGTLPAQPDGTHVRYRIEVWDAQAGRSTFADSGTSEPLTTPPFAYLVDRRQPPAWLYDAMIYQVMVDRFYAGDGQPWSQVSDLSGIVGGTLNGIRQKLPYIAGLGFNALWLSPVCDGPSWHHYAATDHRRVAPHIGTNDDLRTLIREAHAMGLRIILDYVVHATSDEHPFLRDAQANPDSPYRDWYNFTHWPDQYEGFFNLPIMPHLNLENRAARQYIIDTALLWLQDYGVDAFRLDYAVQPSHDFWVALQKALVAANPECATLAEAVASPQHLLTFEGKVDGCLDFAWVEAARAAFATRKMDLPAFERLMSRHQVYAAPSFVRPTFIDNHDMNRIRFMAGGDTNRVRLAAACQFTLSQPPIVLYGTEVGLSQQVDSRGNLDVTREPMPWGDAQDRDLLEYYRRLCALRREHQALRRGAQCTVYVDDETLAYVKGQGREACLVVLHGGAEAARVSLNAVGLAPHLRDALSGRPVAVSNGRIELTLERDQAAILVPAAQPEQ
ncbi:MAG TPA: alpha-amylase family glycosyl hydrolase [Anaerolineae bacterium]|nr:alpha-amylase family glycosyl hydrolase [Anaerolineae bacterium]HQJ51125.1 alpha-amylase family glycosyl hydrolase [Anaerolineae bacterium]